MTVYALIDRLITLCIQNNMIDETDTIYCRNRVLALLQEPEYEVSESLNINFYETLYALADYAIKKEIIVDSLYAKDIFCSNLMNIFIPLPSIVNKNFFEYYDHSPVQATQYFYTLSQNTNYIKTDRIAKNIMFKTASPYGEIDITINLSKPEKDPKQIALEKTAAPNKYPACLLCPENEGYEGTVKLPDRANHRMIRLSLNNKDWMLQYSPYLYYNEHCILLSTKHEPMKISKDTFYNLLEFVEMFPHYFVGSNADLPIVGGSILAHEHYQGGSYTFPLNRASVLFDFEINGYPNLTCRAMNWPLSTLRLSGKNIDELVECSHMILEKWRTYNDPSVEILAQSDGVPHNTITPIARQNGNEFEIDLVLRNNRTTAEHPLGIFHPHADVQHIKKENIGLIEVMGLAILPGRLLDELEEIKDYILGKSDLVRDYHKTWADQLKLAYTSDLNLDDFIQSALGAKFTRVLEDAGVFKLNETGIAAFNAFTNNLN